MNSTTTLSRIALGEVAAAGAAAALATTMLLAGVAALFTCEGAPLQAIATAQHACADRMFLSEREACVRAQVHSVRRPLIASR